MIHATRTAITCLFSAALLGGAILTASSASAGPDRLSILLASKHIDTSIDFNEFNPGVFLTWEDVGPLGMDYSGGVYYNSYSRMSPAILAMKTWEASPSLDLGIFGGLAYYPDDGRNFGLTDSDVVPLVGLHARYGHVFVQALPGNGKNLGAVLSFGLSFEMD